MSLGEPLSPTSDCKSKGLHYTVKRIRNRQTYGVECLICGLTGDLDEVRKQPCTPSPAIERVSEPGSDLEKRKLEDERSLQMAQELQELEILQAELEQQSLLERLEMEEIELQGLLNQKRAMDLAFGMARHFGLEGEPKPDSSEPKPEAKQPKLAEHPTVANEPKLAEHAPVANDPKLAEHAPVANEPKLAEHAPMANDPKLAEHPTVANEPKLAEHPTVANDPKLAEHPTVANEPKLAEHRTVANEPKLAEHPTEANDPKLAEHAPVANDPKPAEAVEPVAKEEVEPVQSQLDESREAVQALDEPKDAAKAKGFEKKQPLITVEESSSSQAVCSREDAKLMLPPAVPVREPKVVVELPYGIPAGN